tara:strand:- start:1159 stop:1686 length:528 start_codon:yes stop_codon:yes gene_type:complete
MASMNAAFWINPTGKIHRVGINHISDVIKYPKKFGLSQSEIRKVFDKHNELYGHEGRAREEILKNLFKDNFIRIRKYKNIGYTVNVKKLAGKAKKYVQDWADKLLGTGIEGEKDYTTTPVHFDAADKNYSQTTLGDIQKDASFGESKQYELIECHVSEWEDVKLKKFKEFIDETI